MEGLSSLSLPKYVSAALYSLPPVSTGCPETPSYIREKTSLYHFVELYGFLEPFLPRRLALPRSLSAASVFSLDATPAALFEAPACGGLSVSIRAPESTYRSRTSLSDSTCFSYVPESFKPSAPVSSGTRATEEELLFLSLLLLLSSLVFGMKESSPT